MIWRKSKFAINAQPGGDGFEGWTCGDYWNGWDVPVFTRAQAERVVASMSESLRFDSAGNVVYNPGPDAYDPTPETYTFQTVEGIPEPVVSIGDGWVWEEVEPLDEIPDPLLSDALQIREP